VVAVVGFTGRRVGEQDAVIDRDTRSMRVKSPFVMWMPAPPVGALPAVLTIARSVIVEPSAPITNPSLEPEAT
jgi:hypothetical protein